MQTIQEAVCSATLAEQIKRILKFYIPLLEKNYEDHQNRLNDLETLEQIAGRYNNREEFLTDIAIEPPEAQQDVDTSAKEGQVVLSTIHSAKGLQWHTVFVIHLVDGYLPSFYALSKEENIEEERRLLYVAATRAKENLYLITPKLRRRSKSAHSYPPRFVISVPSRFITENKDFEKLTEEWALEEE